MAGSIRCFVKLNLGLLSSSVSRHIALNQTRTLFSMESLGMVAYNTAREAYKTQFYNLEETFRNKMKTYVENEAAGMIFTEDLKVILHIAENTPEDKDLVIKMIAKFDGQSSKTRFTTFSFGPIVMRCFHRLNEPELALKVFYDQSLGMFCNQLASYQILLDLLYLNKRYKDMMNVYSTITSKITDGKVHPRNSLLLVTAGCYKENTPESLEYAINLWQDLNKRGYPLIRRVLTHLAALALNQGKPPIALEMLMTTAHPHYITLRCLKVMAFCDMDRVENVIPFFRRSINQDTPDMKKETYFADTIQRVEAAIERAKLDSDTEIVKLLKLIKAGEFIQNDTLDDNINIEIKNVPPIFRYRNQDGYRSMRSSSIEHETPQIIRRPGLRDLV